MPTYEYRCRHCGHKMEAFQNITANPLRKCPACGRMKLERLISAGAGLIFKGPGFYVTDYAGRKSGASVASSAEKPSGSAGKGDTGKGEAAPAAKNGEE